MNQINIIGGGLAGCVIARRLADKGKDVVIFEREKIGGLCCDNRNYQDLVHILHTDNPKVWNFVANYTKIRPHRTLLKSYVKGTIQPWPVPVITQQVIDNQIEGYSRKMWLRETPREAFKRITTNDDGFIFHEKYEGIPDFTKLFENLTKGIKIVQRNVKDFDLTGKIVLTGAIDEYFDNCYGKLPYRGMKAVHFESEVPLEGDFVTFSDELIPFQRLVDYHRLGYEGNWIGLEVACNEKHYPIRDKESEKIYNKYKQLAERKGVTLAGRLGTYHYLDMDEVIEQALEIKL